MLITQNHNISYQYEIDGHSDSLEEDTKKEKEEPKKEPSYDSSCRRTSANDKLARISLLVKKEKK